MTGDNNSDAPPNGDALNDPTPKAVKRKPTKALPNNRLVFSKHLDILRGYVAASGNEKKPVTNDDVGKVVSVHPGTVSNCNPFFHSVGLLRREKNGYVPCDDVIAYADRYKWEQDKAALKLAPVIRASWFAQALLPKLNFRSLSKDEAMAYLAEDAGADPEYKQNLELLLDYLKASGLITVDGSTILLGEQPKPVVDSVPPDVAPIAETPPPQPITNQPPTSINNLLMDIHPSIVGVLLKLPKPDRPWTNKDKKRFMSALGAVLDLVYDLEEEAMP